MAASKIPFSSVECDGTRHVTNAGRVQRATSGAAPPLHDVVCDLFAEDFSVALMEPLSQDRDAHRRVSAWAIRGEEGRDPEIYEVEMLATELRKWLKRWASGMNAMDAVSTPPADMLPMDAAAARLLEAIGPSGEKTAANLRQNSRSRWDSRDEEPSEPGSGREYGLWKLWLNLDDPSLTPVRFTHALAIDLWHDIVRRKTPTKFHPALSIVVVENYTDALNAPGRGLDAGQIIDRNGQPLARVDGTVPLVPNLEAYILGRGGYYGARLVRHVIHTVWDLYAAGLLQYDQPIFEGGFSGLARDIGLSSNKAGATLRDLVRAYQTLVIRTGQIEIGGLWTYHTLRRGGHIDLQLKVGAHLCPGFEQRFNKGTRGKKLVPCPRHLPPLVGRHNDYASNLALQNLVLVRMRDRAEELAGNGAILIPTKSWKHLIARASMPAKLSEQVQQTWVEGNADTPPFLTRPDEDWFGLAPAYGRELKTLLGAAKQSRDGRARQARKRKQEE